MKIPPKKKQFCVTNQEALREGSSDERQHAGSDVKCQGHKGKYGNSLVNMIKSKLLSIYFNQIWHKYVRMNLLNFEGQRSRLWADVGLCTDSTVCNALYYYTGISILEQAVCQNILTTTTLSLHRMKMRNAEYLPQLRGK